MNDPDLNTSLTLTTSPSLSRGPAARKALRTLRVATVALASALIAPLAGCVVVSTSSGCSEQARFTSTKTETVPLTSTPGLDVETSNGAIKVDKDADDSTQASISVTVRAQTQERADAASIITAQSADGGLSIRIQWPEGRRRSNEGASVEVTVPDSAWVRLKNDNGSIECTDLRGVGEFRTTNGRITVRNHNGDAKAATSNGAIELTGIRGSVEASSNNGRLTAEDIDGFVTAETTNGRVEIALADSSRGPVKIETTNGGVGLTVGRAFTGELTASTTNGSIRDNLPESMRKNASRRAKTFSFTTEGVRSEVSTSNGSIEITGRM